MDSFTRLSRRPSLADDVSQKLSRMILDGELAAGEQLPTEQSLAESFGVARTVVREAVSRLKHDGMIDSRQGVGAFVAKASARSAFRISPACFEKRQKLLEILQLRTGISSEAAGLAATRRTAADLDFMENAYSEMESSISEGDEGRKSTFWRNVHFISVSPRPREISTSQSSCRCSIRASIWSYALLRSRTPG